MNNFYAYGGYNYGAMGNQPMAPSYPPPQANPQVQYANPYCNVNQVPVAKNPNNLYINPANIAMSQSQFVNNMQQYARENYFRQQQLQQQVPFVQNNDPYNPRPDYYGWKLRSGTRPRTPEEEEETFKYYMNVIYPAERGILPNQPQQPTGYSYQPAQQFTYGSTNNNPYAFGFGYSNQISARERYLANQAKMYRNLSISALKVQYPDMSDEKINEILDYNKPENIMKRQQKENERIPVFEVAIVRGDEVVVKKTKTSITRIPPQALDFVRLNRLAAQPPVQYVWCSPYGEFFRRNQEKYANMSLLDFFNKEGANVLRDTAKFQKMEERKYRLANSYDHDRYKELIKSMEVKDAKYNDGLYNDLVAYRLEVERTRPEGFHYDPEKKMITIETPDDFEEFARKDAPKIYNRRKAFYKHVLSKHPEMAHILEGIEFSDDW